MFKQIATNNNFWKKVNQDTAYKPMVDRLFELYDKYCICDIPATKYSDYKLYFETGDRLCYEEPYFHKRVRMNTLALLCLIYPENKDYLINLQNTIWAICDEYSWVLPAHVKHFPQTEYTTIDLFSAETAFALSEIKYLLKDKLDDIIKNRIDYQVEKNVLSVFKENLQAWESTTNNWASVCAGSVAAAFMYQRPDEFENIKPRIDSAMKCFLSGYPDDGTCLEGMAYWVYGFGFYIWYADLLKEFTNGHENLFENQKVKRIADFAGKIFLTPDTIASFSDSSQNPKIMVGMLHFLKTVYGDDICSVPNSATITDDRCGRWCHHIRSFVYFNKKIANNNFNLNCDYFLKDSEWYIKRTPSYSFAIKAGNNDEPHNHNDIGSFILSKNNKQILADFGCGAYTRQYFRPETRYSILCNSSLGHSVPIINGKPQLAGEKYSGIMNVTNGTITVDMTNAYGQDELLKLERTICSNDNGIKLTDYFEFKNDGTYVCRLVSYIKPMPEDNKVILDCANIFYDCRNFDVLIKNDKHFIHDSDKSCDVYLIDFVPKNKINKIELDIIINNH
ncbi:MAG: heparinase II/III family protein [Clostridia bacterium]|nr:heparinase II/III family protein [Clostridia bacterium]